MSTKAEILSYIASELYGVEITYTDIPLTMNYKKIVENIEAPSGCVIYSFVKSKEYYLGLPEGYKIVKDDSM